MLSKGSVLVTLGLMVCEMLVTSTVYPSGAALATASAPMTPPAPGRFSTTTGTRRFSDNPCDTLRAAKSAMPPGAKATITRMDLVGYACPEPVEGASAPAASSPISAAARAPISP